MAGGFFKGVLWGAGVSLGVAASFSILAAPPAATVSGHRADETQPQPVHLADAPRTPEQQSTPAATGLAARDVPIPEPDTIASLLPEVLAPAAVPEASALTELEEARLSRSDERGAQSSSGISTDSAAFAQDQVNNASPDADVSLGSGPAQPMAPVAAPQETAVATLSELTTDLDAAQAPDAIRPSVVTTPDPSEAEPATAPGIGSFASDPMQPPPPVSLETVAFPDTEIAVARTGETVSQSEATAVEPQPNDAEDALTPVPGEAALTAQESLSDRSPDVANAPEQPDLFEVQSDAPSSVSPEAEVPRVADVAALGAPGDRRQSTLDGESASARVVAELEVDAPKPDPRVEDSGAITGDIDPVPDAPPLLPLPSATVQDATVAAPAVEPAAATLAPEDIRPIRRYARPFENPEGRPLMSVVLMDDGLDLLQADSAIMSLEALPYQVSLAVDTQLPDAVERIRRYRAAGLEVLATVDLPDATTAREARATLAFTLANMPEIVGILEGTRTGIQNGQDTALEIAQLLARTGHGFLTQERGANTLQTTAAQNTVPSATVFRDVDNRGQSATVISRFLDQAAFVAGQEGSVILLGRLREETIEALRLWVLQDRAAKVAMSPISAALLVR